MTDEEKKWRLGISAKIEDSEISPELKISDQIDENQKLEIKISKDKIYADYELKF